MTTPSTFVSVGAVSLAGRRAGRSRSRFTFPLAARANRCLGRFLVGPALALATTATCAAGVKTWDGGAGTFSWHDGDNWNPDGVPGAGDDVVIEVAGDITVTVSNGTNTVLSLDCAEDLTLAGAPAPRLVLLNGLTLDGTLTIGSACCHGRVEFQGSQTLGGTGDIVFDHPGSYNGNWLKVSSGTLTIGPDIVVHGGNGQLVAEQGPQIVNQGTISSDVAGRLLNIQLNSESAFTNEGTVEADTGTLLMWGGPWSNANGILRIVDGTAYLAGSFTTAGLGTIDRTGGTLAIGTTDGLGLPSTGGTLNNSAAALMLDTTGTIVFYSGTITGGVIASSGPEAIVIPGWNGVGSPPQRFLDGVTLNADISVAGSIVPLLRVTNGLTLDGTLTIGSACCHGRVEFQGSQTLGGTGDIVFDHPGSYNGNWLKVSSGTLTIGPDIVVHGGNGQLVAEQGPQIVNQGTISSDVAGRLLNIQLNSESAFTNEGAAAALSGSMLVIAGGPVTNYFGPTNTLTGGTWSAGLGSTLNFPPGAAVQTLGPGAAIALSGAGSSFPAMNALTTIGDGASFSLDEGRDFAASPIGGTFVNNGTLSVAPECDLDITGSYTQGAMGLLDLDLSSVAEIPISATAAAALDGTLDVDFVKGFAPPPPADITLLSAAGGVSGTFAKEVFPAPTVFLGENTLQYEPTSVVLGVAYLPGAFIGMSGGSWSDSANWGAGIVPGADSDVYIPVQVLVDRLGAIARDVTIMDGGDLIIEIDGLRPGGASLDAQDITVQSGGSLHVSANGQVSAATLLVQSGAALVVDDASAIMLVGSLTIEAGATFTWSMGTIAIDGGTWLHPETIAIGCDPGPAWLVVGAGSTVMAPAIDICLLGSVSGDGVLDAEVTNGGTMSPGSSAGTLTIDGDYAQSEPGTLSLELGGLMAGSEHDVLVVSGTASLDGTLAISLINAFEARAGETFDVLTAGSRSGQFQLLSIEHSPGIHSWPAYAPAGVSVATGSLPNVTDQDVAVHASVANAFRMSFDAAGTLYVGRETGGAGVLARIARVGPGGGPVDLFADPLSDPDAVAVDHTGTFTVTPGGVLVGGSTEGTNGAVHSILPDGQTSLLFGPSPNVGNPADLEIDSTGRLLLLDFNTGTVATSTGPMDPPSSLFMVAGTPVAMTIDHDDRIYVTRQDGVVGLYDHDGAAVDAAFLSGLSGFAAIAYPPQGGPWGNHLYVIDRTSGELLRVAVSGDAEVMGSGFETFDSATFGPDGALYALSEEHSTIARIAEPAGADADGDGVPDDYDNCPDHANAEQSDCDHDGAGDVCVIATGQTSDVNMNGLPDNCEEFAAGDTDGNGVVNVTDMVNVILAWGGCDPPPAACLDDLNDDGQVNVQDLVIVILNWS